MFTPQRLLMGHNHLQLTPQTVGRHGTLLVCWLSACSYTLTCRALIDDVLNQIHNYLCNNSDHPKDGYDWTNSGQA